MRGSYAFYATLRTFCDASSSLWKSDEITLIAVIAQTRTRIIPKIIWSPENKDDAIRAPLRYVTESMTFIRRQTAVPRPPLNRKNLLLAVALSLLCQGLATAKEIEGVKVPGKVQVDGKTLTLQGAGVRSVSFLGLPVKVYVGAFYSPQAVTSLDNAVAAPKPMQFDFTFLRSVGQNDVTKAWNSQFAASNTYTYPGFEQDLAKFVAAFGPLNNGDVESVRLLDGETQVFDKGQLRATIPGQNFQKAFLSLWLGTKPVTPELKKAFMGQ